MLVSCFLSPFSKSGSCELFFYVEKEPSYGLREKMHSQNPQMQTATTQARHLASATRDSGRGRQESKVSFWSGGRGQMSDRG